MHPFVRKMLDEYRARHGGMKKNRVLHEAMILLGSQSDARAADPIGYDEKLAKLEIAMRRKHE